MAYPMTSRVSKPPLQPLGGALGSSAASGKKPKSDTSWLKGLVTLIVVLIIIGGGIYLIATYTGVGGGPFSPTARLSANWQAVFLSNGQVYFGKIIKINKETVVLRDIYYLQVVTQPLQRSAEGEIIQQEEQRLTLIKLGNEIHGPKDEMIINRDHVVLMEDLKDDGRVVTAINDYIKQGAQQQ